MVEAHRRTEMNRGIPQRIRSFRQHYSPRLEVTRSRCNLVDPCQINVVVNDGSPGLEARERICRDLVGSPRHILIALLGGCSVYGYFDDHRLGGHMRHRSPWSTPAGRNPTRPCPTRRWAGSFFAILHPVEDECHQPGGDGGTVSLNAGSAVADVTPPAISWRYRWRSVAFAPVGNGIRRRRGSDGLRLVAAAIALLVCLLIIRYGYRVDSAITRVVNPPPASISWLVTLVYDAGAFGVTAVLVVLALVARRFEVARDIGLSVVGTGLVSGLLVLVLGTDGGRGPGTAIHGYSVHFPVYQIAAFMAVATASLPYLARTLQRLVEVFVVLVALASVVGGHGLPLNVMGSMAIGWGITAIVHLVFGSPLGAPLDR